MANTNAPFGLKPVKHLDGSPWNEAANLYLIDSGDTAAYYIGDTVISATGVAGDTFSGAPAVTLFGTRNAASTSGSPRGVIVGVGAAVTTPGGSSPQAFDPNNLNIVYIPATKAYDYYVWVVDDPTVIFEAQTNSLASATYGYNAPLFVANAPTAPQNQSASYVQGSAANTTQALPLKIMGGVNRPDNDLSGTAAFAKLLVKFNQHELFGNTLGV